MLRVWHALHQGFINIQILKIRPTQKTRISRWLKNCMLQRKPIFTEQRGCFGFNCAVGCFGLMVAMGAGSALRVSPSPARPLLG